MKKEYLYIIIGILSILVIFLLIKNTEKATSHAEMTMDEMVQSLQGKSGDAFDKEFIDGMIVHHQGAVEMAKLAIQNANHQEIVDLAEAIIEAQEKEINQMHSWYQSWYGVRHNH